MYIEDVKARQILDSRGNPTVEVDVALADGGFGRAAVPSGASTGIYEACELRDGGDAYMGKGVTKAVANVNDKMARAANMNIEAHQQRDIDSFMLELDGTENKSNLGANATLAVSLAVAKSCRQPRPAPVQVHRWHQRPPTARAYGQHHQCGKHADNKVDFQEFMVMPVGASSFSEAIQQVMKSSTT